MRVAVNGGLPSLPWLGVELVVFGVRIVSGGLTPVWRASVRRLHMGVVWRSGEQNMGRKGVSLKLRNCTTLWVLMKISRLQRPVRDIFFLRSLPMQKCEEQSGEPRSKFACGRVDQAVIPLTQKRGRAKSSFSGSPNSL